MRYNDLVDRIVNASYRRYHPYISTKSGMRQFIHFSFMVFFLIIGCAIYNINFYTSTNYLQCAEKSHQQCRDIETICHVVKYTKTINADRYIGDIRPKPGDLVKDNMDVTYYDVYSERYPELKYVANMTYLTHYGIVNDNDDDPTYKCYHSQNNSPQIKCDFTHQCIPRDIELLSTTIMVCMFILAFPIPVIIAGAEF